MHDSTLVGLWGCGAMGTGLAHSLVETGKAHLAVVYDIVPEAASNLADRYGAQVASSLDAFLDYPSLDGVIIALPPYLHLPAAAQAAQAGLGIFVEKPMAPNVADCQQMLAAVERYGVKLMVGQVLRYYEPYRTILRWQDEGRFGQIYAASIWRITDGRKLAGTAPWRASRAKSGGYLLEVGAHELDMLRCLLGQPQTVYALGQKVLPRDHELLDYVTVQVRFIGGGAGTYEGGAGTSASRYGFRFYFDGAVLFSETAFKPQALHVYDMDGQLVEGLEGEFSSEHPVEAELRAWISALRDEAPVAVPGTEGLATVALAQAAYRSAETGQVVTYDTGL